MSICGTWVEDVEALCPCGPCDFAPEGDTYCIEGAAVLERWALIASELLYAASGRQFPGVCSDTVRPCSTFGSSGAQSLAYAASGGSRAIVLGDGSCGGPLGGCGGHGSVLLPHRPVRSITEVVVDGATLDPSLYQLVDRRWVVRSEGAWPCTQNLGLADTEDGTWSITYDYGIPPPAGGAEVAGIYACELAKGCANDTTCRLPRRVQTITREGISMTVIDPFDFLDDGLTGLYEVDAWVKAQNRQGADRRGRLLNPDLLGTHRTL